MTRLSSVVACRASGDGGPFAIDVAPMPDLDHENHQPVVLNLADQAKVANAVTP
jgi:hypothetical protein